VIDAFLSAGLGLSPGDVVTVSDSHIKFPLNLVRKAHERRFCLVLSNNLICEKSDVILMAPMTSDTTFKSMSQIEFAPSPGNGLELNSRVLLDQIQPMKKAAILEKMGSLSLTEWELVMTQIVWNFDRA
jgi:mRNA-degrading endonuclease toxin of MazEF toxin-antitoxin module